MKTSTVRRAVVGALLNGALVTAGVTAQTDIADFRGGSTVGSDADSAPDVNVETTAWLGPMGFWLRCWIPRCGTGPTLVA